MSTGTSVCVHVWVRCWFQAGFLHFSGQPKILLIENAWEYFFGCVYRCSFWGATIFAQQINLKGSEETVSGREHVQRNIDWLDAATATALNPILMKRIDAMRLLGMQFRNLFLSMWEKGTKWSMVAASRLLFVIQRFRFGNLHSSRILFYAVQNK